MGCIVANIIAKVYLPHVATLSVDFWTLIGIRFDAAALSSVFVTILLMSIFYLGIYSCHINLVIYSYIISQVLYPSQ